MSGLITMDDLTNEEIIEILDDAERLLPVAKENCIYHCYKVEFWVIYSLNQVLEQECHLRPQ